MRKEITYKELEVLNEIVKIMKTSELIFVTPKMSFGLGSGNGFFQSLLFESGLDGEYLFIQKDIKALLKEAKDNNQTNYLFYDDLNYEYGSLFSSIYKDLLETDYDRPIESISDFQDTDQFIEFKKLKSDDGAEVLSIGDAKIFLNPTVLPINASDKVNVNIFQWKNNNKLVIFNIVKKKSILLQQYFIVL